jgi:hypothetical protein
MDASAVTLMRDNQIPIVVFNIREQGGLARVLDGEGTVRSWAAHPAQPHKKGETRTCPVSTSKTSSAAWMARLTR